MRVVSTMIRISDVEPRWRPGDRTRTSPSRSKPRRSQTALAAVTSKVELGINVLQLPLRNPIELAHWVQSL
jgi:hypothetical protein